MKRFLGIIFLLSRFAFASSDILECVKASKTLRQIPNERCPKLFEYLRTHPLVWTKEHWMTEDEQRIRQQLELLGIRPALEQSPVDLYRQSVPGGELLILYYGDRLLELARKASLPFEDDDHYTSIKRAGIFQKKKSASKWETTGDISFTAGPAIETWFDDGRGLQCHSPICLGFFYSPEWPEIHATGPALQSHVFNGEKYVEIETQGGRFRRAEDKWLVFVDNRTADFTSEDWARVTTHGKVLEYLDGKLVENTLLSNKYFAFPQVQLGKDKGNPPQTGLFCKIRNVYNCVEITPSIDNRTDVPVH